MDTSQPLDGNFTTSSDTFISSDIKGYLQETAKWGKFLSIVGFIMIGLIILAALGMGAADASVFANMPGGDPTGGVGFGFIMVMYLLIALLYFFPTLYLYRFSTRMQTALSSDNQAELSNAFENLKSVFKFWGIFTAVMLGFYALMFVISLVGFAAL